MSEYLDMLTGADTVEEGLEGGQLVTLFLGVKLRLLGDSPEAEWGTDEWREYIDEEVSVDPESYGDDILEVRVEKLDSKTALRDYKGEREVPVPWPPRGEYEGAAVEETRAAPSDTSSQITLDEFFAFAIQVGKVADFRVTMPQQTRGGETSVATTVEIGIATGDDYKWACLTTEGRTLGLALANLMQRVTAKQQEILASTNSPF